MVLEGQAFVVGGRHARAVIGDFDGLEAELLELDLDVFGSSVLLIFQMKYGK